MKTKTIRQTITLTASPSEVYDAWMDQKKHSAFVGAKSVINPKVGGSFDIFDGYATGKNLGLEPGKRIVQSWKTDEEEWPADHYSKIDIRLKAKGKSTVLTFVQTGVPGEAAADISKGWKDYYWTPLKAYFKK